MPEESTTPDLAELNRRAIESAACRDWDAAMVSYGPDSVWDGSPLGTGTYRGVATIRSNMEDWYGLLEEVELEIQNNVDLGSGVVLPWSTSTPARSEAAPSLSSSSRPSPSGTAA
jgi:hypothetical protein